MIMEALAGYKKSAKVFVITHVWETKTKRESSFHGLVKPIQ